MRGAVCDAGEATTMAGDPQIICDVRDRSLGLEGVLVIDSVGPSGACGGIRITEDVTREEVMALARAMTLKYRFLGVLPLGGAKAGIVLPPDCTPERHRQLLEAFGRHLAPILEKGIYRPWTDMNSGAEELNRILRGAGLPARQWPDSGYYTALTVVGAIRAACEVKQVPLRGLTVALEGFGSVGSALARELHQLGACIVALSTAKGALYDPGGLDIPNLLQLRRTLGADVISHGRGTMLPRESLFELPADVLVPGARPWTINTSNVGRIQARMIIPAANVPVTEEAKPLLHARGKELLPDFVCNSGGALGSYLRSHGLADGTIREVLLDDFRLRVKDIMHESIRTGRSAEQVVVARSAGRPDGQTAAARPGLLWRAIRGIALSPVVPGGLVRRVVLRRVRRRLRPVEA